MTAPSLYHHFGSKAGVYEAVLVELNEVVISAFEHATAGAATYVDRVVAVIDASRAIQRREPDIAQFVLTSQQDVARHADLAGARPEMSRLAAFAAALAATDRPTGMTQDQAAKVVLALIFGLARMAVVQSPREYRATTDAVIAMVRGGLV